MALFSNRPGLERMMKQKPDGGGSRSHRLSRPTTPAMGCAYGMGRRCIGVCYKELLAERRKHA